MSEKVLLTNLLLLQVLYLILARNAPSLETIVPFIYDRYFILNRTGNQYHLRIWNPYGGSLDEVAELKNSDTNKAKLSVQGIIRGHYAQTPNSHWNETLFYTADKNGYRVKFSIILEETRHYISTMGLKSAAG